MHCVDLDSDSKNCGYCGTICRIRESCGKGRCVCDRGRVRQADGAWKWTGGGMECSGKDRECCDGECMEISRYQSDPQHCGKCIVQCEKDEKCVNGKCEKAGKTISLRLAYVGFKFVESTPEDCPGMRSDGKEVLTSELRLVRADPDGSFYEGPGRFSADIDGCGLTPNREDPGEVYDRGDVPGDFHGDNFLGCKVTTVVPEHAVRVRVEVNMVDAKRPNSVEVEWEPVAPAVGVKVSTGCEPAYQAGYVKQMAAEYRRGGRRQITDYDLLPRLAPGGKLQKGVYRSVDDEGLTLTID